MIERLESPDATVLAFRISGKLHDDDYKHFVPVIEEAIAVHGKVRVLVEFVDFHGWDMTALWDDIQFDAKHYADIEKVAILGDKAWEKWMAAVCKPFTSADIKYFDQSEEQAATTWIAS